MRIWISVILLCYLAMFIGGIIGFIPMVIAACAIIVGWALGGIYIDAFEYVRNVFLNR